MQEEYSEKCGDGTPEGGEKVLFSCHPGHALFSPLMKLLPDSRFTATGPENRESQTAVWSLQSQPASV